LSLRISGIEHCFAGIERLGDFKLLNLALGTLNPVDISNLQSQKSFWGVENKKNTTVNVRDVKY